MTCRQEGQSKAEELAAKDLRAELEEKERKHFLKAKGHSFEGAHDTGLGGGSLCGPGACITRWVRAWGHLPVQGLARCTGFAAQDESLPCLWCAEERQQDLRLLEDSSHAREGPARTLMPSAADADDEDDSDAASSSDDDDDDEVGRLVGLFVGLFWPPSKGPAAGRPTLQTGVGQPSSSLHRLCSRGVSDLFRGREAPAGPTGRRSQFQTQLLRQNPGAVPPQDEEAELLAELARIKAERAEEAAKAAAADAAAEAAAAQEEFLRGNPLLKDKLQVGRWWGGGEIATGGWLMRSLAGLAGPCGPAGPMRSRGGRRSVSPMPCSSLQQARRRRPRSLSLAHRERRARLP